MIRTRIAAVAAAAVTALALGSAPASAAGETQNVCANVYTPAGWVDVNWWSTGLCGPTLSPNAKQMKNLTGLPVGTQLNACGSTYPPAGWTIVSSYYSDGCRYFSVPNFNPNTWTIKRTS
ncbi:hypothetical protein LG634_13240 [Streptomyces bambusae]|uniref:hypothetical protein n=1 Tax=Streptomyces bambusae TaxID=1550616 RepID=UPI001CFE416E|nr:hypothetical protein [Streptomyces bambusae]MCB5165796.1 hypothetical protein [Streptomyces bambusae]